MGTGQAKWKKSFFLLWGGQALSILTSSVLQMAIVWYITEQTGSATLLTLSTLTGFLPHAILGVFIGSLIDRYDRKKVMILSDLVITLAGLALAVVGLWRNIPIWLIFVVLFIRAVGSAFHTPSLDAVIPLIVPEEQLSKCAGYSQSLRSVSLILSPVIAAALFSIWELSTIILLDVAGAIIAMCIVAFTAIPKLKVNSTKQPGNILRETKEGFAVIRSKLGLTALLVVCGLYAFLYFPIGTLYPHITMTYFGGDFADSSVVEVVFSVGMLLGSFLLSHFGNRMNKSWAICCSIGVYGLGVLFTGMLPPNGLRLFVVFSFFMGIAVPFFHGMKTAVLQVRIEKEFLGRALSLSNSISMAAMPLGLLLGGTFADKIGVNRWFFLSGIMAIALAVIAMLMPSIRHCGANGRLEST